jgi:FKBP-type peptidyl-prolyl cis-trans isomerase FkpA
MKHAKSMIAVSVAAVALATLSACKQQDIRRDEPSYSRIPPAEPQRGSGAVGTGPDGRAVQQKPSVSGGNATVYGRTNEIPTPVQQSPSAKPGGITEPAAARTNPPTATRPNWDEATTPAPTYNTVTNDDGSNPAGGRAQGIEKDFRRLSIAGTPTAQQVRVRDTREGNGREVADRNAVMVHYTGYLYDPSKSDFKGAKFDSSRKGDDPRMQVPMGFMVGVGKMIKGFDEGVLGMKQGGTRTVIIPPEKAYGATGGGPIPPNATLVFDVELIRIIQ